MRGSHCLKVLLASISIAGCGGSATAPGGDSGVNGTWTQVGGTRAWHLTQAGIQAAGSASFTQTNNPTFGAVSATGSVEASVLFGTFMFEESYERLSGQNADCYITVDGQLTISGDSMSGSYTEVDACAGVHLGQITGKLTMQRK